MVDYSSLADRIVKVGLRAGARDVVARVYVNRSYQIRFAQNQAVISNRWRDTAAFIGLAVDKRVILTEIQDLERVEKAVEGLASLAKKSQESPLYAGIAEGPFEYSSTPVDKRLLELEEGGDLVEAAVNAALEEGARETAGSFWRCDYEHFLKTSNGAEGHDRRVSIYISLRAFVGEDSSGHGVNCATRLSDFKPEEAGRKAGRIASMAKTPKSGKEGTYDILFEPLIFGALTYEMGLRAGAFHVLAGLSPLKDKLGQRVASEAVTLVDDGSADSINRKRFDDEGVPTRRNVIIDSGILKTYLHNTSTAKHFKQETTGNAGLIQPHPHALFCQPGDRSKEEMLEDMKDGLWLTNTWYTRYQSYVTGDFSTIPRDGIFRVKNGEVVEVWKDIRLTDNMLSLWQRVEALSKDVEQVKWWYEIPEPAFTPYALVRDVGITTSAM